MFTNNNSYTSEQEENGSTPERAGDSPSTMFNDMKMSSTSSPKRSRRAVKKRVVSIPIKDVDGSRAKGESAPPSDSWAWRKYGQKPIKGSPYPRGYYRCSSSKGCPARKQVERSRMDPTTLLITYSSEHNHPWPASRNHHNHHSSATTAAASDPKSGSDNYQIAPNSEDLKPEPEPEPEAEHIQEEQEDRFPDLSEEQLITGDQFRWFGDMETMTSAVLESPVFADDRSGVSGGGEEVAMFFPMREEDESLFADLGELPECSVVFRRGALEREEERRRRCTAGPCCGTTG